MTATPAEPTTSPAPFDFNAPLPPMPDYHGRSWEPAARRYQDLTEAEKTALHIPSLNNAGGERCSQCQEPYPCKTRTNIAEREVNP